MKKLLLFALLVLGLGSIKAHSGWQMEEQGSSTPWELVEGDTPTLNNDWALTYR